MEKYIVIRPRGRAYVFYLALKYGILLGVLAGLVLVAVNRGIGWWLALIVVPIVLLVLQTREVFLYKITVSNTTILLAANRDLWMTKHTAVALTYRGLEKLQYCLNFEEAGFIVTKIALIYDGNTKYLDVSRYSNKQIKAIMQHIKTFAEQTNERPVEVLPNQTCPGLKASDDFNFFD